jgi:hypothetical protein
MGFCSVLIIDPEGRKEKSVKGEFPARGERTNHAEFSLSKSFPRRLHE